VVVGVRVGALYFAVKVPTLWRNILPPSSVWLNVVHVFSVVTGRNKCVSYVRRLLGFVANHSYGRGNCGEVSSKPMSNESFPETDLFIVSSDWWPGGWMLVIDVGVRVTWRFPWRMTPK
jgi:hypothetical protein